MKKLLPVHSPPPGRETCASTAIGLTSCGRSSLPRHIATILAICKAADPLLSLCSKSGSADSEVTHTVIICRDSGRGSARPGFCIIFCSMYLRRACTTCAEAPGGLRLCAFSCGTMAMRSAMRLHGVTYYASTKAPKAALLRPSFSVYHT